MGTTETRLSGKRCLNSAVKEARAWRQRLEGIKVMAVSKEVAAAMGFLSWAIGIIVALKLTLVFYRKRCEN